jgi:hypothetical protein
MVLTIPARRAVRALRRAQVLKLKHKILTEVYLRKYANKLTRDKETYHIQRFALGRVETDQITKFIKVTEKKFDKNWKEYEDSLYKYLTSKTQGEFKDWIQRKDDIGNVFWTNTTTLKTQVEHPGQKIFNANKKILQKKAQEELDNNLADITERRLMIMETIIGLKGKVSADVSQIRLESALSSKSKRASWMRKL